MVDYVSFSDDIESVFTVKGLEKNPTKEPEAFTNYVYESGVQPTSRLIPRSEGAVLNRVLTRLIEKVKQRRLDVLSYLEDFDFVNEGIVF